MKKLTLTIITILTLFSCQKEDNIEPQLRTQTVNQTKNYQQEFIGRWNSTLFCTHSLVMHNEAGKDSTEIILYQLFPAKLNGKTFIGVAPDSTIHSGVLLENGTLEITKTKNGESCSGIFHKR